MIIKDSLLVEELTDDMVIDDLLVKYDDSSAYMFGKVKDGNKTLINKLREYIPYGDIIISFNIFIYNTFLSIIFLLFLLFF